MLPLKKKMHHFFSTFGTFECVGSNFIVFVIDGLHISLLVLVLLFLSFFVVVDFLLFSAFADVDTVVRNHFGAHATLWYYYIKIDEKRTCIYGFPFGALEQYNRKWWIAKSLLLLVGAPSCCLVASEGMNEKRNEHQLKMKNAKISIDDHIHTHTHKPYIDNDTTQSRAPRLIQPYFIRSYIIIFDNK